MSEHIHRSHNASALLYHLVCPANYRQAVFSAEGDAVLRDIYLEIAARYEVTFLKIGTDRDHVHFLVQSIPPYSPTRIARVIKSLTAREGVPADAGGEKVPLGRGVLVRRLLRQHGQSPWDRRGRSGGTLRVGSGRGSIRSSVHNSSDYSQGIRPAPDTPRLAAG